MIGRIAGQQAHLALRSCEAVAQGFRLALERE